MTFQGAKKLLKKQALTQEEKNEIIDYVSSREKWLNLNVKKRDAFLEKIDSDPRAKERMNFCIQEISLVSNEIAEIQRLSEVRAWKPR